MCNQLNDIKTLCMEVIIYGFFTETYGYSKSSFEVKYSSEYPLVNKTVGSLIKLISYSFMFFVKV